MRLRIAALLAGAWLAGSGMAFGQTVDRGNEVTVNPIAGGSGGVLLYPGGQYMRVVHPALEPGESGRDLGPIHLHMPTKRVVVAARKAPAKPVRQAEAAAPPEPKVAPAPKAKEAKAKPQPKPPAPPKAKAVAAAQPQPAYDPGFGDPSAQGAAGLNLGGMMAGAPAPAPAPSPPPAPLAQATPPPAH